MVVEIEEGAVSVANAEEEVTVVEEMIAVEEERSLAREENKVKIFKKK